MSSSDCGEYCPERPLFLFDMDNTLVYTDRLSGSAYQYACGQLGYLLPLTRERMTRKLLLQKLPQLTPEELDRIVQLKQAYFAKHLGQLSVNTGLVNFLRSCPAERCCLVSGSDPDRASAILRHFGWEALFSRRYHLDKSRHECLDQVIGQLARDYGSAPEQFVMFDDDPEVIRWMEQSGCLVNPSFDRWKSLA